MVRLSHMITTVSRSLTSTKMARLSIVVSFALENDPRLIAERKAREEEERKKAVAVKLETLTQHEARIIGCENLCNSTMRMLDIRKYLTSRGWKRDQMNLTIKVSLMNPSVQINIQASDLYSSVTQMVCR